MIADAQPIPGFSIADRLGLAIFGSVLAHLLFVLGTNFAPPKITPKLDPLAALEVTLVQTRSDTAPTEADYLAQANQEGGGEHDTPTIARSPLPVRELSRESPRIPAAQPKPAPAVTVQRAKPDLLTQTRAERRIEQPKPQAERPNPQREPARAGLIPNEATANERARLSAEISRSWEEYQKRPRRKFLSARTREYKYAAYMDAWRAKVERVGNLNYPEEAKRLGLTGNLQLDVALNPDGSINDVRILKSSGKKVLDDAAVRIVNLAAPYASFPDDMRRETDILHITRTWEFLQGSQLQSR